MNNPTEAAMRKVIDQVNLGQTHGSTDKVYVVTLFEVDGGYTVEGANGRRGSVLIPRPQTKAPVTLGEARLIFDQLARKKMSDNYKREEGGVQAPPAIEQPAPGEDAPPMQLLTAATEAEMKAMLDDPAYLAQPKYDCKRLTLVKKGERVTAFNRRRLACALPAATAEALLRLKGDCVLDVEAFSDYVVVFDVQQLGDSDYRPMACYARTVLIDLICTEVASEALRPARTAITSQEKWALFDDLKANNEEGIVFKRTDAPYTDGRPNMGGPQRKAKFWKTATVRVLAHHPTKTAVVIEMLDEGRWRNVGRVTVKANQTMPPIGARLEVKYLYAFPGESGALFQPEYLMDRSDEMTDEDCQYSQLIFKAGTVPLEAAV